MKQMQHWQNINLITAKSSKLLLHEIFLLDDRVFFFKFYLYERVYVFIVSKGLEQGRIQEFWLGWWWIFFSSKAWDLGAALRPPVGPGGEAPGSS